MLTKAPEETGTQIFADSVMVKKMVNKPAMCLFYRQVAKDAKKSLKLGALGVLAVVQYHPDEYRFSPIHADSLSICENQVNLRPVSSLSLFWNGLIE